MSPTDVLAFWFSDRARALWFDKDAAFDDDIRATFGASIEAAATGAFETWRADGDGALALTIMFDQFPRNIYRGLPRAFAYDPKAREVATAALANGWDMATTVERRMFFYLPFEHSEVLTDQDRSVELFTRWAGAHDGPERAKAEDELKYVHRHREIIQRFGRFPHRNAALGRSSTPAELAFLNEPVSSF